jgi:hypothetical protein
MFTQISCHTVSRYMARLLTKLPFFVLTYCLIISPSCARLTDKESDFDATMPLHNAALLDKDPGDRAKAEDFYKDALRLFRQLTITGIDTQQPSSAIFDVCTSKCATMRRLSNSFARHCRSGETRMAARIFRHRRRLIFKNNPDRDGWKTDQTRPSKY